MDSEPILWDFRCAPRAEGPGHKRGAVRLDEVPGAEQAHLLEHLRDDARDRGLPGARVPHEEHVHRALPRNPLQLYRQGGRKGAFNPAVLNKLRSVFGTKQTPLSHRFARLQ